MTGERYKSISKETQGYSERRIWRHTGTGEHADLQAEVLGDNEEADYLPSRRQY